MFSSSRPTSPHQYSVSRTFNDNQDTLRSLPPRYAHDLAMSSQSLTPTYSHHDDLPAPAHASNSTSAQSTPMTSPSTAYSSLFPGSLSSATSESLPCTESKYQSEFGLLNPGSSAHSPIHGSSSSRSSHPVSPLSPLATESDHQASALRLPRKYPSSQLSRRPSTAPHPPNNVLATASTTDSTPSEHHTRTHSRLAVSIKNLLSKPAVLSPSRFTFNSSAITPTEGEVPSHSFHAPSASGKWTMITPRKSRPPDLEISGSVLPAMPSPSRISSSPMDAHRRYASEVAAKTYHSGTGNSLAQENLSVSTQNAPLPPVRGKEPKTRNVLKRRPSAKLHKARERGMSSPARPFEGDAGCLRLPSKESSSHQSGLYSPLTAAGAVVEAYKQQELYRDDPSSPSKLSIDGFMGSASSHEGRSEHSPAPYYTVFGSTSGRRVQVGGSDDRWSRFEADQCILAAKTATSSHQSSPSGSGGRSLTRRISSRWRKIKGGGVEDSPLRDKGHSKGRPSLQELWGGDRSVMRPTGRSIDGVTNAEDGAWASPIAGHARSESDRTVGSEGGKLWRLMRRISTGGLRDRFQTDKVVPPVPAIPKELLGKVHQGERGNETLLTSHHQPPSSSHDRDHTLASTSAKNMNAAVGRPSVATVSSSTNSSDVASSRFFHKTHSTRSSVSSYGEIVTIPRIPEIVLDRRIIEPLEQLRLADNHVESGEPGAPTVPVSRSPRRSTSVPVGLRTEGEYMPLPSPRRQTCSGDSPGSSRPSSTSASGSASGSPHTSFQGHGGRSRMADGIVSLSPPPRPPRDARRGTAGSPPQSMLGKQVDGIRQMDRTASARSDLTARIESPEPRRARVHDRDDDEQDKDNEGHVTFRELDVTHRPPLSEREKADIWDNLLARSDKAGGTLHIHGAAALMSDSMRFSTISETM